MSHRPDAYRYSVGAVSGWRPPGTSTEKPVPFGVSRLQPAAPVVVTVARVMIGPMITALKNRLFMSRLRKMLPARSAAAGDEHSSAGGRIHHEVAARQRQARTIEDLDARHWSGRRRQNVVRSVTIDISGTHTDSV